MPEAEAVLKRAWDIAMSEFKQAQQDFARGDANAMKRLWSNAEDVTIFGAFGGHERGWQRIGPRIDWAASQFAEGSLVDREFISSGMGADLSYTVHLDRMRARIGPSRREGIVGLRVTQIWRREGHGWRIVHRHGDHLTSTEAPP